MKDLKSITKERVKKDVIEYIAKQKIEALEEIKKGVIKDIIHSELNKDDSMSDTANKIAAFIDRACNELGKL
jgi:hypothetical protein